MLGNAQTLFAERRKAPTKKAQLWPFLDTMLSSGFLGYIDFALAQKFKHNEDEDIAAFLCHLSMAARQGHLCIKIDHQCVIPSPEDIWKGNEEILDLSHEDIHRLNLMIVKGAQKLPSALLNENAKRNTDSTALIQKQGCLYYFHKCWKLESDFMAHFTPFLSNACPSIAIDPEKMNRKIDALQSQGKLLPEQATAILQGCQSTFTLITGGPGTGKTYAAGMLLNVLWDGLSDIRQLQITLAAPTGKAAANLESSIKKTLKDIPGFPAIAGQTLHQLLKIRRTSSASEEVLSSDIVIVDECSMIDADVMCRLLYSIKPGARLILLGDKNQLPSVEAGSLFADMADYLTSDTKHATNLNRFIIELKTCLRAESKSISVFSDHIKQGNVQAILDTFSNGSENTGIRCISIPENMSPKEQQQLFLKSVLPNIPNMHQIPDDPKMLLDLFNRFRILTPLRKGLLGSEALNAAISSAIHSSSHTSFTAIPIMIVKNDHRLELFNGEVGVLIQHKGNCSEDFTFFPSRHPGDPARKIPALLLPKYEAAYCLSIHKSQGSEFEHVALLLPEGAQAFGREGLYTGTSRAKKMLEIWSRPEIVASMAQKQALRLSGVCK